MSSTVYLLHFDPPYRHARHYAGYTTEDDLFVRLERHRQGRGARLCRVAVQAGCNIALARVWHGVPRMFELELKKRSLRPLCPMCSLNAFNRKTGGLTQSPTSAK